MLVVRSPHCRLRTAPILRHLSILINVRPFFLPLLRNPPFLRGPSSYLRSLSGLLRLREIEGVLVVERALPCTDNSVKAMPIKVCKEDVVLPGKVVLARNVAPGRSACCGLDSPCILLTR